MTKDLNKFIGHIQGKINEVVNFAKKTSNENGKNVLASDALLEGSSKMYRTTEQAKQAMQDPEGEMVIQKIEAELNKIFS